MPTEVISTIRASGGDYTTLSAWEAGEQRNLVTADEIAVAVCYNDWPSGLNDNVTIDGWTTDATRYVKITVAEGHRHNGTPRTGFWITRSTAAQVVRLNSQRSQVEWVDAVITSSAADARAFYSVGSNVYLRNCIGQAPYNSNNLARAIDLNGGGTIIACLGIGSYTAIRCAGGSVQNCVAVDAHEGFARIGFDAAVFKNNVAFRNVSVGFGSGTYGTLSRNNASDDATATGASPAGGSVTGVTSAAFVDAANNDFHLSSGSVLRGAGVNLYSDFQTDIDGDTWPSSGAWDIGFDYYVAAGGSLSINSITASDITSSSARITLGLTR